MLKETITYEDYNGVTRTEDFWFNFTKAELMEMQYGVDGGLAEMVQRIINAKDQGALIKIFKKLVLDAYGEKSPDGRRFIKSKELSDAFAQTEAYSQIFMKLASDDKAAGAFVNGIVPKDLNVDESQVMAMLPGGKA